MGGWWKVDGRVQDEVIARALAGEREELVGEPGSQRRLRTVKVDMLEPVWGFAGDPRGDPVAAVQAEGSEGLAGFQRYTSTVWRCLEVMLECVCSCPGESSCLLLLSDWEFHSIYHERMDIPFSKHVTGSEGAGFFFP